MIQQAKRRRLKLFEVLWFRKCRSTSARLPVLPLALAHALLPAPLHERDPAPSHALNDHPEFLPRLSRHPLNVCFRRLVRLIALVHYRKHLQKSLVTGAAQNGSGRPMSPLGTGNRKTPSPNPLTTSRDGAPSRPSESITSPQSPTRLHPLTDLLREKDAASQKTRSQSGMSVHSHRTAATNEPPTITVQVTPTGQLDSTNARPRQSKLSAPSPHGGHSRSNSRVSKRSGSSKETSRHTENDDDDDDDYDNQMKALVMHDHHGHSHGHSHGHDVTEIDLTRTPRTSYTAYTTPSVLAHEVNTSHFHDEELCILLHAADKPATHDVVRQVLRRGVRERIQRLGLDHQREVSVLSPAWILFPTNLPDSAILAYSGAKASPRGRPSSPCSDSHCR